MHVPQHARVGLDHRAKVGDGVRDARRVLQAHDDLVLESELLALARDVQHGEGREEAVGDVVHLAIQRPDGGAEESDVHHEPVDVLLLRGAEHDLVSGHERRGGVQHQTHERVLQDLPTGETDSQTGDPAERHQRADVHPEHLEPRHRRHHVRRHVRQFVETRQTLRLQRLPLHLQIERLPRVQPLLPAEEHARAGEDQRALHRLLDDCGEPRGRRDARELDAGFEESKPRDGHEGELEGSVDVEDEPTEKGGRPGLVGGGAGPPSEDEPGEGFERDAKEADGADADGSLEGVVVASGADGESRGEGEADGDGALEEGGVRHRGDGEEPGEEQGAHEEGRARHLAPALLFRGSLLGSLGRGSLLRGLGGVELVHGQPESLRLEALLLLGLALLLDILSAVLLPALALRLGGRIIREVPLHPTTGDGPRGTQKRGSRRDRRRTTPRSIDPSRNRPRAVNPRHQRHHDATRARDDPSEYDQNLAPPRFSEAN